MIYMYYYAGINTEEIAKLNDCASVNIRQALYVARNTIKSRIEGQTGKYTAGAVVSLAAIFFAEEQAFAAEYVGASAVGTSTAGTLDIAGKIAGTMTTTASGTTVVTAAACVIVAGAVFATAYLTLWQTTEEVGVPQPAAAIVALTQVAVPEIENSIEEIEEEQLYIPNGSEYNIIYENYQAYETVEPEITRPEIEDSEVAAPPQLQTPYVEEPSPPEIEPEIVDNTREILAALTGTSTYGDVNNIIARYGFVLVSEARTTLEEQYRFYVVNEGSGEIMIGVGIYEDNRPARIRFEHFQNSQRPTRITDLLDWIYR
jgi:hypothetical protein